MIFAFLQTAGAVARQSQADVSALAYLNPIFAFLVVAVVIFAILRKSGLLGDHVLLDVIVALFVPAIFITVPGVSDLILSVIPWFAVLVMALFFILFLASFVGNADDIAGKGLALVFIILLAIVFIVAAVKIFSGSIFTYLPGPMYGVGDADPDTLYFLDWFYSPPVFGAFWLIIAAIVVGVILVKTSG